MAKRLELDQNKLNKLEQIREMGVEPYPYSFDQKNHAKEVNEKFAHLNPEDKDSTEVSVAGRVMLRRIMGKASFFHIQDETGKVQIYLTKDDLGPEVYELFAKKIDTGDIVGITGSIFKTRMGEVTVHAKEATLLCKSLLPMPEKFHGIKDVELKYRRRYLDLITNPESREVFKKRSAMIKAVRDYFSEKGFMEVETPILQTQYGGANARPFITHINAWDMPMFLSISPELSLKRLLVGGFEKVFTICKNFRNEDVDPTHNPEFTMLEIYQAFVDYEQMMVYLEEVYEKACLAMNGTTKVKRIYKGEEVEVEFKAPWRRLSMIDSIKEFADIDVSDMSRESILNVVKDKGIEFDGTEEDFTWGLGVQLLFEELVEDKLIQPTHIIDHPKESTPLCKGLRGDARLIERFESFCLGMEISNAYSELNDPVLQRELLEEQADQLRAGADEAHPMDEDFVNSIEYGMPPAGGLGFGIDRMAVVLSGVDSIRDVIFFPTVKPIEVEENKADKSKDTKIAVALLNKGLGLEKWQELNSIAHLSAAFAARVGKQLFMQDTIKTKDGSAINLNIQHAIMIKDAKDNAALQNLIVEAKKAGVEVSEFTREMFETTDDRKVVEITAGKEMKDVEFLGILLFGDKKVVDSLTKEYPLYS